MTARSHSVSFRRSCQRPKNLALALGVFGLGLLANRLISAQSDFAGMWLALAGLTIATALAAVTAWVFLSDLLSRRRTAELDRRARAAERRERFVRREADRVLDRIEQRACRSGWRAIADLAARN